MRTTILLSVYLALIAAALPAAAAPDSAYTRLDFDKDCTILDQPAADDEGGDWAELLCPGYKGYPVYLSYGDARESLFYGFPPDSGPPRWESFGAFNGVSGTIEWRLDGGRPFATIHRWTVNPAMDDGSTGRIEVLVVSKVGQPDARDGCVAGYVVATGNPGHNAKARQVADRLLDGFDCASSIPVRIEGSVPLPATAIGDREN